jgi:hypothetical protein
MFLNLNFNINKPLSLDSLADEPVEWLYGVERDSSLKEYGKLSTKSRENMYSDHTATILNMLLLDSLYHWDKYNK